MTLTTHLSTVSDIENVYQPTDTGNLNITLDELDITPVKLRKYKSILLII
jgi:hypothetical protein